MRLVSNFFFGLWSLTDMWVTQVGVSSSRFGVELAIVFCSVLGVGVVSGALAGYWYSITQCAPFVLFTFPTSCTRSLGCFWSG